MLLVAEAVKIRGYYYYYQEIFQINIFLKSIRNALKS